MIKIIALISTVAFFFMMGCRKDTSADLPDEEENHDSSDVFKDYQCDYPIYEDVFVPCGEIKWPHVPEEVVYRYKGKRYTYPVFNPNNNRQIAYMQKDKHSGAKGLFVLDLDRQSQKLIEPDVSGMFDWSKEGWLVYAKLERELWKIKADGSQRLRLTEGLSDEMPKWISQDDSILFVSGRMNDLGSEVFRMDAYGKGIEPVGRITGVKPLMAPNGKQIVYDSYGIDLYHLETKRNAVLLEGMDGGTLDTYSWLPCSSTKFFYIDGPGSIKMGDIARQGWSQTIKYHCDFRNYTSVDAAADSPLLVASRTDTKQNGDTLTLDLKLVVINLETGEENVVLD